MEKAQRIEKKNNSLKNFATFLIWGGIIGIFLWAAGKSLGLIHSPAWVEMMPYFFGGGSLGGIAIYCGKVLNRLDRVEDDVKDIDNKVDEIVRDTSTIKASIAAHEKQIIGLERNTYDNPPKKA
ncbi:MAG: hypothetical protein M0R20_01395 [Candidatus Omnitrophica bacterium]|jgi:hypothetical protein|nr:hypothetical protein [Candidatus Omnitrophota bacterium]